MKKNRSILKEYFKKGAIPTEANFADLIDSMINQEEDRISALPDNPLKIVATGEDQALFNFCRVEGNQELLSWRIQQNRDQKAGLCIGDDAAPRLFIESGTGHVGIGTTGPRSALDTGLGVMTGAANDYMKAQFTLSGGGTVSWEGPGGRLKWTRRFIAISMGYPETFSEGHIEINQPEADIPGNQIYDGKPRSANADGVVLKGWEALYFVHTPGENRLAGQFRIVYYTTKFNAPSNWVLVAVVNSDDNSIKLGTGAVLGAQNSITPETGPIPKGVIVMWNGSKNLVPKGWALCDGQNGTPDLTDRFILGAGKKYAFGQTGGSDTVTLTVDQMPSHNHDNGAYKYLLQRDPSGNYTSKTTDVTKGEIDLLHSNVINAAGGNKPHDNMPPYYALAFIMKL